MNLGMVGLLVVQQAGALQIACPETAVVQQQVENVADWVALNSVASQRFDGAIVTVGPPEHNIQIVTTGYKRGNDSVVEWDASGGDLWVQCKYRDSAISLVKQIRAEYGVCIAVDNSVEYKHFFVCGPEVALKYKTN